VAGDTTSNPSEAEISTRFDSELEDLDDGEPIDLQFAQRN